MNALAVGDGVVIAVEPSDGVLTTPLIRLLDLRLDPGTLFTSWSRVVVKATHPDAMTTVRVEVLDPLDVVIAGPVLDSGLGTRDIVVDLTGRTEPEIKVRITLTAGSTPEIESIEADGDAGSTSICLGLAPDLLLPPDNARFGDGTPTFRFNAVNPDGNDLHYMIELDVDPSFTAPVSKNSQGDVVFAFTGEISEFDAGFFNDDDPNRYRTVHTCSDHRIHAIGANTRADLLVAHAGERGWCLVAVGPLGRVL